MVCVCESVCACVCGYSVYIGVRKCVRVCVCERERERVNFNPHNSHTDHQNFFGVDESSGPLAISLKRERVPDDITEFFDISMTTATPQAPPPKHQYRIIVRTSEVCLLGVWGVWGGCVSGRKVLSLCQSRYTPL